MLEHLESVPLEFNSKLLRLTGRATQVRLMMYDHLKGKRLREVLTKKRPAAILLMMVHGQSKSNVGHFVCMWRDRDKVMFFDPYGFSLEDRLLTMTKSEPFLLDMIHNAPGVELVESDHHIQQMKDGVEVCGRHVAMRLRFWNLDHDAYNDFIHGVQCLNPDQLVTLMTFLFHSNRPGGITGEQMHKVIGGYLSTRMLW